MATRFYSQRILRGAMADTGITLHQTDFLIIVNTDLENLDIYPWGYCNYASLDTPILDGNMVFWSLPLACHQTSISPQLNYVPDGKLWVYVQENWRAPDALIEIWTPFDV